MRPIDADALIEFCAERWIPLNIDAVNMQPTIQPEKAQLSQEGTTKGTTSDLISRQQAIDAINHICPVDTEYDCTLLDRVDVRCVLSDLPSVQPDLQPTCNQLATDTISRQATIDALDCISGVEEVLRSLPSAQPEYEPAYAEDFAKIMSENTLYNFMAWNNVAFTLMNEMGFVICKRKM